MLDPKALKKVVMEGLDKRAEAFKFDKQQISLELTDVFFANLVAFHWKNIEAFIATVPDNKNPSEARSKSEAGIPSSQSDLVFADLGQVIDLISTCDLKNIHSIRLAHQVEMIALNIQDLKASREIAKRYPLVNYEILLRPVEEERRTICISGNKKADVEEILHKEGLLVSVHPEIIRSQLDLSTKQALAGTENIPATKFDVDFVLTEPRDPKNIWTNHVQTDKQSVVVVGGESGSGKTVYSCLAPKNYNPSTAILYGALGNFKDSWIKNEYKNFIQKMLQTFQDHNRTDTRAYQLVSEVSTCLSAHRNREALESAQTAWKNALALEETKDAKNWFLKPRVKLEHLTLVIDEGTSLAFARAIIDSGRNICALYEQKHAKAVRLVLVGAGLDRIDPVKKTMGTDTTKAHVIIMKTPDLATMEKKMSESEKDKFKAINRGSLSRCLSTNSRMFFRGVWEIMSDKKHNLQPGGYPTSLDDRLADLGSTVNVMDYCLRLFLEANTVGKMDGGKRATLLCDCFLFHWKAAMKDWDYDGFRKEEILSVFGKVDSIPPSSNEIFEVGLAREDSLATSAALKLLACNVRSAILRISDGNSLEEITELHLVNWFKAVFQAKPHHIYCGLKQPWPPATQATEEELSEAKIHSLFDNYYFGGEEVLFGRLKEIYDQPDKGRVCIVFRQTFPTAQGPDLFVLDLCKDEGKCCLHCFQCKNRKNTVDKNGKTQKGDKEWNSWWNSLGVKTSTGEIEPKQGKAGYSFAGIQKLANALGARLGLSIDIGARVIVCAMPLQEMTKPHLKFAGTTKQCTVFSREALEPTITALSD